jgi:site-specific recombinase XerD
VIAVIDEKDIFLTTVATMLLKDGCHSVKAVAERLGDDPITIEKTYAHVLTSMRQEIWEHMYDVT